MTGEPVRSNCPDAETLAEYAEGRLGAIRRAAVEQHLVECQDCRHVFIETATAARHHEAVSPPSFRSSLWIRRALLGLAAAAMLALIAQVVPFPRLRSGATRDDVLVSSLVAALGEQRPVEGRLAGG